LRTNPRGFLNLPWASSLAMGESAVGMAFWSSVRDQDLGSVFGCSRILWFTLRAESLPYYIIYFVRTLVLVGFLPAFMCSRVTWFLRTGMIAVCIRRGAFIRSPCTPSLLTWLLMMIRPTMLGLAVRDGMAASCMRHVTFFGLALCSPPFREYLIVVGRPTVLGLTVRVAILLGCLLLGLVILCPRRLNSTLCTT
jgi:hypothetical protein